MSDKKLKEVIYVEPNDIIGENNLIFNPEDYCISVDLEVGIPDRNAVGSLNNDGNRYFVMSYISKENDTNNKIKFFQGRKIGNQQLLSDYYADVSYYSSRGGDISEAIGLKSIDINYDSWYLPQITIKFIDTKGISLMNPTEYAKQNPEQDLGSFFKAFYTFPYPLFKLQVKGFYGDAVTFDLNCWDVRTELNGETGDAEITTKFVGYTYAFLADLQFNMIKSAPYNEYGGASDYWQKQITDGRFLIDGQPIPPFDKLQDGVNEVLQEFSKLDNNTELTKNYQQKRENVDLLNQIAQDWFNYRDMLISLIKTNEGVNKLNNDIKNCKIIYYSNNAKNFKNNQLTDLERILKTNINTYNNSLNSDYIYPPIWMEDDGIETKSPFNNNSFFNNNILNDTFSISKKMFSKSGSIVNLAPVMATNTDYKVIPKNDDNKIIAVSDNLFTQFGGNGKKIIMTDPFDEKIKTYTIQAKTEQSFINNTIIILTENEQKDPVITTTEIKYNIENIFQTSDNSDSTLPDETKIGKYKYILDFSTFINTINNISLNDAIALNDSREKLTNKVNEAIRNHINFKPSIGNIIKIFFAHLETFMYSFYSCIDKINNDNRQASDWGIDISRDTDINVSPDSGNKNLPLTPFFAYYSEEGNRTAWVGKELTNGFNLDEVQFINAFISSLSKYRTVKEIKILESNIEPNRWLPINPSDINFMVIENGYHKTNPYKALIHSDYFNLITQIGIRMFYGLSCYSETVKKDTINNFAKAEAKNIYDALGKNQNMMKYFKQSSNIRNDISSLLQGGGINNRTIPQLPNSTNNNKTKVLTKTSNNLLKYSFINSKKDSLSTEILPLYTSIVNNSESDTYQSDLYYEDTFTENSTKPLLYINDLYVESNGDKYVREALFSIKPYDKKIDEYKIYVESNNSYLVKNWNLDINNTVKLYNNKKRFCPKENYKLPIEIDENYNPNEIKINNQILGGSLDPLLFGVNKDNRETQKLLRTTETINVYDPFIHYIDKENSYQVSLFGSKLYYSQNDIPTTNDNIEKLKEKNKLAKAMLFLHCLGINYSELNSLFRQFNTSCLKRIPKVAVLIIGSILWRKSYANSNNGKDPINNSEYSVNQILFSRDKKNFHEESPEISVTLNAIFSESNKIQLKNSIYNQLIDYFKEWAINEFAYDEMGKTNTIENDFQLLYKNKIIDTTAYNNSVKELGNNLTNKTLNDVFGNNCFKNYCYISKKFQAANGINIFIYYNLVLRPKSNAMNKLLQLYKEDVIVTSTYCNIYRTAKKDLTITNSNMNAYITSLTTELIKLIDEKKATETEQTSNVPSPVMNEDITNIEKYNAFKTLHDKWCRAIPNGRGMDGYFAIENYYNDRTYELTKHKDPSFLIIDKFYNDISKDFIVNLESLSEILNTAEGNEKSSFLTILSNVFTKHQMLFLPTPNKINWANENSLKNMFKPIPYNKKSNTKEMPSYTVIYTGEPAKMTSGGSFLQKDDSAYIRSSTEHNILSTNNNNDEYNIPCFAVTYGKGNQSYFKVANLSNTNPQVTEQSIGATVNLANRAEGIQKFGIGQDLYSIFSANMYQAEIEMMGCAQLQPMMYFQLNNRYLFSGAYIIYKLSHSIKPGSMITRFTGMKMSSKLPPMAKSAFLYQTIIGGVQYQEMDSFGQLNIEYNPYTQSILVEDTIKSDNSKGKIYGPSSIAILDDYYVIEDTVRNKICGKYYTLYDMIATEFSNTGSVRATAAKTMPKKVADNLRNFIPYIDHIRDILPSLIGKGYYIKLHSAWRHNDNGNTRTFHGYGKAVDFSVNKIGIKGEEFVKINNKMFEYLRTQAPFRYRITELMKEGTNGKFGEDEKDGWIHLAITEFDYKNKPTICEADKNSNCLRDLKIE